MTYAVIPTFTYIIEMPTIPPFNRLNIGCRKEGSTLISLLKHEKASRFCYSKSHILSPYGLTISVRHVFEIFLS
jgi:hypothetical protein